MAWSRLKSALLKLINSKELRQNLVENAKKTALLHDLNKVADVFKEGIGVC